MSDCAVTVLKRSCAEKNFPECFMTAVLRLLLVDLSSGSLIHRSPVTYMTCDLAESSLTQMQFVEYVPYTVGMLSLRAFQWCAVHCLQSNSAEALVLAIGLRSTVNVLYGEIPVKLQVNWAYL